MPLLDQLDPSPEEPAAVEVVAPTDDIPQSIFAHLDDLRVCLIRVSIGLGIATILCYAGFPHILKYLIRPPVNKLVFTSPVEPFFAQCKVALIGGILFSFPWILYQAWTFAAPGLRERERRVLLRLIPPAYALFLLGGGLGLFLVAPMGLKFLLSYGNEYIVPYITLNSYLSYLSYMTLGLAVLFQLPLVLFSLSMLGLIRAESVAKYRRHVFLGLLILAALIVPDIYGQVLIALSTYVLFEISLLAMRFSGSKK